MISIWSLNYSAVGQALNRSLYRTKQKDLKQQTPRQYIELINITDSLWICRLINSN